MKKIKFITFFLLIFFFTLSCNNSNTQPLTRDSYRELLENSSQNQETLKIGTFYGCAYIPATDPHQRAIVGVEKTGEDCSITVGENNRVEVSFLAGVVSVVSTSTGQYHTDTFIGEVGNNQVLIVQHHASEVVSVTHTIYDGNGSVVYGKFGQGDFIKECQFTMTTSEKLAGRKNCKK